MTDTTPGMFLNRQEVAHITGVKIGRNGKTREQLQIVALTQMKIPHFVNSAGRPVVVRTALEGGAPVPAANKQPWKSSKAQ